MKEKGKEEEKMPKLTLTNSAPISPTFSTSLTAVNFSTSLTATEDAVPTPPSSTSDSLSRSTISLVSKEDTNKIPLTGGESTTPLTGEISEDNSYDSDISFDDDYGSFRV